MRLALCISDCRRRRSCGQKSAAVAVPISGAQTNWRRTRAANWFRRRTSGSEVAQNLPKAVCGPVCAFVRARARACLCALGKQLQFALRNCNISVRADAAIANMSFVDIIIWQTNAAAKLKIYWRAKSLVCRPFSRLIAAAECVRLRVACVCLRRLARAIQLRLSQIIYGL